MFHFRFVTSIVLYSVRIEIESMEPLNFHSFCTNYIKTKLLNMSNTLHVSSSFKKPKIRFLGDEYNIIHTYESMKTLSIRPFLYKPISIDTDDSGDRSSAYTMTFKQWYFHRFG